MGKFDDLQPLPLGSVVLQSFCPLKKGTRTFNFRSNQPSPIILGPLVWYDQPWKKAITTKHAPVIFFLAKKSKFYILQKGA